MTASPSASPEPQSLMRGPYRRVQGILGGLLLVIVGALVLGIAGATSGGDGSFVVLAGVAGLLAGAFSMAAGEYVSMRSQTEVLERQIELERAELEAIRKLLDGE